MTVSSLTQSFRFVASSLRNHGAPEWRIESEILLRHTLGMTRSDFLTTLYTRDSPISTSQSRHLESLLNQRLAGEPLAYIVGRREFYGIELRITDRVLIPRQETELLVDIALERLRRTDSSPIPIVADIGTGSGAIALAIATNAPHAAIIATDIDTGALHIARRNAAILGQNERQDDQLTERVSVSFIAGDLLKPLRGPLDIIVSNPPYIPSDSIENLQEEVRREPRLAIDGGSDGLTLFRRLLAQSKDRLAPGGTLIVELMPEQMETAAKIAAREMPNTRSIDTHRDLTGAERALAIEIY